MKAMTGKAYVVDMKAMEAGGSDCSGHCKRFRVAPAARSLDDKALLFINTITNKSFRLWCGPQYKQEQSKRTEQRVQKPRQLVQLFCPRTTTTGQDPATDSANAGECQ